MFGFGIMMFLGPLLFTIAVVWLLRFMVGEIAGTTRAPVLTQKNQPIEILDERLAHGDIDAREYEEKRRILGHG